MPGGRKAADTADRAGPRSGAIRIHVTPDAARELTAALASRGSDAAVRLFVGGGAHPQIGMTVDRATPRDEVVVVDGVSIVIDNGSRPFLDDATIEFVASAGGSGFRVTGPNAPAAPAAPAPADTSAVTPTGSSGAPVDREAAIRAALKAVYDPEIPMNILDLGLIYELKIDEAGRAEIQMTMTSPGCPVAEMLVDQVRTAAAQVPGISGVDVEIVWEPAWGPDRMSEFAKRQLGYA